MSDRRSKGRDRPTVIEISVRVPADKADAVRAYAGRVSKRRLPITREEVESRIASSPHVLDRFGVRSLSLFGSVVRNDAKPTSDIDLMVGFHPGQPGGLFRYVELKHALEGILGRPVDLITAGHIKPRLKARILAECVTIWGEEPEQV